MKPYLKIPILFFILPFILSNFLSLGLSTAEAGAKGSISGIARLAEINGFKDGKVTYKNTPCFGCLVLAGGRITISNDKGWFVLRGVPEGKHSVQVVFDACVTGKHDAYNSPPVKISSASLNHRFRSPLDLPESTGTLSGVARLEGTKDYSGVLVRVEGIPGFVATTDAKGKYRLPLVPVRLTGFKVTFLKSGFKPKTLYKIQVRENLDFNLETVQLVLK